MDYNITAERAYNTPVANSVLLSMLLMSLARTKNAPKVSNTIYEKYDFIVVGSGPGGSAVASRLSEIPCVSVLLLEAGKSPPLLTEVPAFYEYMLNSDIDWKDTTVPQKHIAKAHKSRSMVFNTGKALGGSSVINAMQFFRGNKFDFDNWSNLGAEGWSYDEIFQYFIKMENNINQEFLENGYHGTGGPVNIEKVSLPGLFNGPLIESLKSFGFVQTDTNGPFQTGIAKLQETRLNAQRCSASKSYLVPAEDRPNFAILTNAFVKKVVLENGRTKGVVFDYHNNTYQVLSDREVILSAGAIRTPQLLMLSGIGPMEQLRKFGIPVVADLPVGANFHDHASAGLFFSLDGSPPNVDEQLSEDKNIEEYIYQRTGPLSSYEFFPADAVVLFSKLPLNSSFDSDPPDVQIYFAPVPFGIAQSQLKENVYQKVFGPYENSASFDCHTVLLRPKSRGTVQLRSGNPYDAPLIDPNYLADDRDVQMLVQGMKECYKITSTKEMMKVNTKIFQYNYPSCERFKNDVDKLFECMVKTFSFVFLHPVGTARMGDPTDCSTVVDPELRVLGVQGLRVADASVMPVITSGNTMTPTYMIGEKAADMIKETIQCPLTPYAAPIGRMLQ